MNLELFIKDFLDNPLFFFQKLGYDKLKEINKFFFEILFKKKEKIIVLLAHRNSYKTTILALTVAFLLLFDNSLSIFIVRKSQILAETILDEIKKIMKSDLYRSLYNFFYKKDILKMQSTKLSIVLPSSQTKREPNVLACGMTSNITGLHFDYIFLDDIVTEKDRYSNVERENTKKFFYESLNLLKRGGKIRITGTTWHEDDLFSVLEQKGEKIFKYDINQTNIFNKDEILELKKTMPASLFACNYELIHIADEERLFKEINYTQEWEQANNLIIAHIDCSYGGQDTTAVTFAYKKGIEFIVRGFIFKVSILKNKKEIINLLKRFEVSKVYLEKNADKGYTAKELRDAGFNVIEYQESQNKHFKIITFLTKYLNNIKFNENTDRDYIFQILDYSEHAKNDDAPDSLASLLRVLGNQISSKELFFQGIAF